MSCNVPNCDCGLPFVPAPKPANICLASEDDLIFPWRDLYPLCGQTVLYGGEEWTVLQVERGGSFRKLWRYTEDSTGAITGEFSATVDRMECRPLGWSILDELCIQLQATVDGTGVDAIVLVMEDDGDTQPDYDEYCPYGTTGYKGE